MDLVLVCTAFGVCTLGPALLKRAFSSSDENESMDMTEHEQTEPCTDEYKLHVEVFLMAGCGHCERFMPELPMLRTLVDLREYGPDSPEASVRGIRGYPTILIVDEYDQVMIYNGNRVAEDIAEAVQQLKDSVEDGETVQANQGAPRLSRGHEASSSSSMPHGRY